MDNQDVPQETPVMNRFLLAGVLTIVGLAAVAMLILAAAAVVFR